MTKIMDFGSNLDVLKKSGKNPCSLSQAEAFTVMATDNGFTRNAVAFKDFNFESYLQMHLLFILE